MKSTLGQDDPIPIEDERDDWLTNTDMTIEDVCEA
jgi:hypothetical protein